MFCFHRNEFPLCPCELLQLGLTRGFLSPLPASQRREGRFVGRSGSTRSASSRRHSLRTQRRGGRPSLQATPAEPRGRVPSPRPGRFSLAPHCVFPQTRVPELHLPAADTRSGCRGGQRVQGVRVGTSRCTAAPGPPVQEATPRVWLQPTAAGQGPEPFDFRGNRPSLPHRTPTAPPPQAGRAPGFYSAKAAGWLRLSIWEGLGFLSPALVSGGGTGSPGALGHVPDGAWRRERRKNAPRTRPPTPLRPPAAAGRPRPRPLTPTPEGPWLQLL